MSNRKELPGRPDAIFSMVEDYSRQKEYDKAERLIENYVYYCVHFKDWENNKNIENAERLAKIEVLEWFKCKYGRKENSINHCAIDAKVLQTDIDSMLSDLKGEL